MKYVLWGAALCALASCQVSPSWNRPGIDPIAPQVLSRFDLLDGTDEALGLQPIHVLGSSEDADSEGEDPESAAIELEDVLESVQVHFPLILAAQEEIEVAEGLITQARGGFDSNLNAKGSLEDARGFYESERVDVFLEQPTTLWGATFSGGYRLGQGDFAVYDGKAKTNDDGELRIGVDVPLLQGRAIDARRLALWRARVERDRADPVVSAKRLEATRKATDAYWKWVAAGRNREVATRLLALAQDRGDQVTLAVEEGLLAPLNLTENQRLIVDRQATLVRAERQLQKSAIELSLYWRDEQGRPRVPADDLLPYEFPTPRDAAQVLLQGDEQFAVSRRPELQAVQLQLDGLNLQKQQAENQLLPRFDLGVFASQDYGSAVNVPDDKGDFELGALLTLKVPLQRRKAKGKVREITAKYEKLEWEAQFLREVIVSEVQDARSALDQSWLRIAQAEENVRLANELAEAERFQLSAGESDLLRVNLREQQAAAAAASLIDSLQQYFRSLAVYRAVLGIPFDPETTEVVAP